MGALSMRLTAFALEQAALAVVLVFLAEAKPKPKPLTAHVGIHIKSDNTEEAPDVFVQNRPWEKVPTTPVKQGLVRTQTRKSQGSRNDLPDNLMEPQMATSPLGRGS